MADNGEIDISKKNLLRKLGGSAQPRESPRRNNVKKSIKGSVADNGGSTTRSKKPITSFRLGPDFTEMIEKKNEEI